MTAHEAGEIKRWIRNWLMGAGSMVVLTLALQTIGMIYAAGRLVERVETTVRRTDDLAARIHAIETRPR